MPLSIQRLLALALAIRQERLTLEQAITEYRNGAPSITDTDTPKKPPSPSYPLFAYSLNSRNVSAQTAAENRARSLKEAQERAMEASAKIVQGRKKPLTASFEFPSTRLPANQDAHSTKPPTHPPFSSMRISSR